MKFLYFTRSNGDIDNMQDNKALTTSAKRKEFIGDEATKFSVQDGVLNPVWDGSKYIKDPDNKESERLLAKHARSEALRNCTSELNGNVFQTRPSDEPNFRLALAGMEDGDKEEWILENDTVVEVSKDDLFMVLSLGLQAIKNIYSDYKKVLKEL